MLTTDYPPTLTQREFKIAVRDMLRHGDQTAIANALDVSPSDIKHRIDPDYPDRKLGLAIGMEEVRAICIANREAGRALKCLVDGLWDRWLEPSKLSKEPLSCLVCSADKEHGELIMAHIKHLPAHIQLKEAIEAQAALTELIRALQEQERTRGLREAGR